MLTPSPHAGFTVARIQAVDGKTTACFVPERGGTGCSITLPWQGQAREILYRDPSFWDANITDLPGGWPFLFPVCGRLAHQDVVGQYGWQGQTYSLPIHGVSWNLPWRITPTSTPVNTPQHAHPAPTDNPSLAANSITLTLTHCPASLAMFPFAFRVQLTYTVTPGKLQVTQRYYNEGDAAMPYYAGFHPYFLMPDAGSGKANTLIDFSPTKRLAYNAQLTAVDAATALPLPALPGACNSPALNETLYALGDDRRITLNYPDGFRLTLTTSDAFTYCQLYTQANKPFFCIEPWMGYPGGLNQLEAGGADHGVRWLAPGEMHEAWLTLS